MANSAIFIENGAIHWFRVDSEGLIKDQELLSARSNSYVRRWRGTNTEQVCAYGCNRGLTLQWSVGSLEEMAKAFAEDVKGWYFASPLAAREWLERRAAIAVDSAAVDWE